MNDVIVLVIIVAFGSAMLTMFFFLRTKVNIYLGDQSGCVFHPDRGAILWACSLDHHGELQRIVPFCSQCADSYEDLMRKTYGADTRCQYHEKKNGDVGTVRPQ